MKYTLQLKFEENQKSDMIQLLSADKWESVCWDMDQWLRSKTKYEGREDFSEVRRKLNVLMQEYRIEFSS